MCEACFSGRAISAVEIVGEIGRGNDRRTHQVYYARNRSRVLATHRKWREARKLISCPAD